MALSLVYIGNFGRSWNTEEHVARDAEALGIEVLRLDENRVADWLSDEPGEAVAAIGVPDLVLYTKTHGLPADPAVALWRSLERHGTKTASYHLDLYAGLARGEEVLTDPFWRTGTVFTADGGPSTTAALEQVGVTHRWLAAACVSDEVCAVEPDTFQEHPPVIFVGSHRGYHAEWPWRGELLRGLRRRYGSSFEAIGAPNYVRGLALNRLYQTPGRVVVGDSLALPGRRNYWSDRYYETLGRGGFLVAPGVPGLEKHFTEGLHFSGYDPGNLEQVFALVDLALSDAATARRTALEGQAHVRRHHTYKHRVVELLSVVGIDFPLTVTDDGFIGGRL